MTATEVKPQTISKPLIFINRCLIFFQLFILAGLAALSISRPGLEEIGQDAFESSNNLIGSRFVHTEILAFLAAMIILTIYKEIKMSVIKTKIFTNFMTLGVIAYITEILVSTLYPI